MKNKINKIIRKLLVESSKKKVLIDKLGLSESNAEILDELCGSLAVWMANKLIGYQLYIIRSYRNFDDTIKMSQPELIDKMNSNNLVSTQQSKIVSIMDFIRIGLNGNISTIKELPFEALVEKSKEWHNSLNVGGGKINYSETAPILIDFRDDNGEGYYWADLGVKNSPEECERMGHCGRSSYGYLYSLRSDRFLPGGKYKLNRSHLTASIGTDGILYQLKGQKNSKPKDEYHKYIQPLFYVLGGEGEEDDYLIQGFGSEYASQQDFKISDLPDNLIKDLYNNRPELFKSRSSQKKLISMGLIEPINVNNKIKVNIYVDRIGEYVDGDYRVGTKKRKLTNGSIQTENIGFFESILSGDAWRIYQVDEVYVDWESALKYDVNSKNEGKIMEILSEMAEQKGIEIDPDKSLIDLIKLIDTDYLIIDALTNSVAISEEDSFLEYAYNGLKSALETLGYVEQLDDQGAILIVDMDKYLDELDDESYDEIMDRCDDDLDCVFNEMINNYIDKPEIEIDDRWTPDIDENNFNFILDDKLSDI